MSMRDLMATGVPVARPEGTVREAARLMDEAHVKVLPVCEGDRLMGVLTDSDVISAIADGGAPETEFVRDYMSTNVVAVTPDTGLAEAGQLMRHAGPEVTAGGVFADLLRLAAYLGANI